MNITELRKSFIFRTKRRALLIETLKDFSREGLLNKDIAKMLDKDPAYISSIKSWDKIPSNEMVETLLTKLNLWKK